MKSILLTILILFLVVNVGVLYYIVLFGDIPRLAQRIDLAERRLDSVVRRDEPMEPVPEVQVGGDMVVLSAQQQQELIDGVVAAAGSRIDGLVVQKVQEVQATIVPVQEDFIPLGRASVKTPDHAWKSTGLQAEVDMNRYLTGAVVTFEATLSVPTANGEVEARIVDHTTGYVIGSEIKAGGSGGSYRKSGQLSLGEGARTLEVQMRTSMDYEGVMENGRLRIVTGTPE